MQRGEGEMSTNDHLPVISSRYQAERALGAQPAGDFFVAVDTEIGGRVTVFFPRLDDAGQRRFARDVTEEIRRCRSLLDTPYCTIRDGGVAPDGAPFVVVDRPQGTPLSALMRARGRLSIDRALSVAVQLCDLVRRAHRAGIYPVPATPESIIVHPMPGGRQRVSLVDLGFQRGVYGSNLPLSEADALYRAPQLRDGESTDPRDDVFAITAVLHAMVFGVAPLRMSAHGPANGTGWPVLPDEGRGLDRRLEACLHTVLLKGLAPHQSERFATLDALQRALTGLRQLMSIAAPAFELLAATRTRVGRGDDPLDVLDRRPAYDRAVAARAKIGAVMSRSGRVGANLLSMPTPAGQRGGAAIVSGRRLAAGEGP